MAILGPWHYGGPMAKLKTRAHHLCWPDDFHLKLLYLGHHLHLSQSSTVIVAVTHYLEKLGPIDDFLPTREMRELARSTIKQELGIKEEKDGQQGPPSPPREPRGRPRGLKRRAPSPRGAPQRPQKKRKCRSAKSWPSGG